MLMLLSGYILSAQVENLIYIENSGTRLGILTDVGGRIVYLSSNKSENLLKSDPAQWKEDKMERPEAGPFASWKAYNGHIVWNGPQSEWWIYQDVNPERKRTKAVWPPDPYLIYGQYAVTELKSNAIRLKSPESKVSGLSLEKLIEIEDDGSVLFKVKGTNIRNTPISWDLWLNSRVDGYANVYVPVESSRDAKVRSGGNANSDTVRWNITGNYFHYIPEVPPQGKTQRSSKAFITPSSNLIAAFVNDHCLLIRFPEVSPEKVHPAQAIVEIYNQITHHSEDALMELEFHAPYNLLAPGVSMETWEKWEIREYPGKESPEAQVQFLKEINQ